MPALSQDQFTEVVELLTPLMDDENERKSQLTVVLSDKPAYYKIDWGGAPKTFIPRLVHQLSCDELTKVLISYKNSVGSPSASRIDSLCEDIAGAARAPALAGIRTGPRPSLNLDHFESVLLRPARESLGHSPIAPQPIEDVLKAWQGASQAGDALVLIMDFRIDVQQTLLAVSRDVESAAWIDGGTLLGPRRAGRYNTTSTGSSIEDLRPSLILVDFSTMPLERALGRAADENGAEDAADAQVAEFLAWARSRGHSVVLGLPRYVLLRLTLPMLRRQSAWVYTSAALYARGYEDHVRHCAQLLGSKSPFSQVLLRLLAANSSSLPQVADSILASLLKSHLPWNVLDQDALGFVLEFADRLVAAGFYEVAYRLESYCRTARRQKGLIFLGADLYPDKQEPDNTVVGFLTSVVDVPTALSFARVTGDAGSGKTTVLLQIEHHWALPKFLDEGIYYHAYLHIYISCRSGQAYNLEHLILSALRQVDFNVIESKNQRFALPCHSLISTLISPRDLPWILSSPLLLLLDDVDQLAQDDLEQLGRAIAGVSNDYPALGILLAFRKGAVLQFANLNNARMREMNEEQVESLIAQKGGQSSLSNLLASNYHSVASYVHNPYLLTALCELGLSDKEVVNLTLHDIVGRHIDKNREGILDEISERAVQEWLPAVAFALRFPDAEPAKGIDPHDQQMLLAGRRMGLIQEARMGLIQEAEDAVQFKFGLVSDYFVARHMAQTIKAFGLDRFLQQWHDQFQHVRAPASLLLSLRNVFKILVGFLNDKEIRALVEFLLRHVDARLAHECVLELPADKVAAYLEPAKFLADHIGNHADLDLQGRIEDARILGYLDPRITDAPWKNLVLVNSSDQVGSFRVGRYPTTNMEYAKFVNAGGYETEQFWSPAGWQWLQENNLRFPRYWRNNQLNRANWPVVGVSYYEANAYCKWLSSSAAEYVLPTAAEWDLAAHGAEGISEQLLKVARRTAGIESAAQRAQGTRKGKGMDLRNRLQSWLIGTKAVPDRYPLQPGLDTEELGALVEQLRAVAKSYMAPYRPQLELGLVTPVGLFQANSIGCYDLFGNVWEWCNTAISPIDEYAENTGTAAMGEGDSMVVKGGCTSATYDPIWLLIGGWFDPHVRFYRMGFRVVCRSR